MKGCKYQVEIIIDQKLIGGNEYKTEGCAKKGAILNQRIPVDQLKHFVCQISSCKEIDGINKETKNDK